VGGGRKFAPVEFNAKFNGHTAIPQFLSFGDGTQHTDGQNVFHAGTFVKILPVRPILARTSIEIKVTGSNINC